MRRAGGAPGRLVGAIRASSPPTSTTSLGRDDVDLVVVATVHDALAGIALRAVEAGKHVLVEKPGATRRSRCASSRDAAAAQRSCVRVGFNHRFHPALLEAREHRGQRPLGPLMFVRARYGHGGRLGYEQEWRADREPRGGGELVDQGIHLIDLVRSCFGDVDLAFAEMPHRLLGHGRRGQRLRRAAAAVGGFAWLHASGRSGRTCSRSR